MLPGAAEEGALPLRSLPGMGAPGRAHRGCRLTKDSQAAVSVAPRHSPGWPGLWSLSWKCHCTLQANLWDFQEEWLQASPRQRKAPPGEGWCVPRSRAMRESCGTSCEQPVLLSGARAQHQGLRSRGHAGPFSPFCRPHMAHSLSKAGAGRGLGWTQGAGLARGAGKGKVLAESGSGLRLRRGHPFFLWP